MKSLVTAACSKPLSQTRQVCHQPCWGEAFRTWFHGHGRSLITFRTGAACARKNSGNRTPGKVGKAGWRKSAARSSHPCECLCFPWLWQEWSSPNENQGIMASFHKQLHPLCWEVLTEQSASDHQAGNCKLLSGCRFNKMPLILVCVSAHAPAYLPTLHGAVL